MQKLPNPSAENAPWLRIAAIIEHYNFKSISSFASRLGLRRAENLYQIKRGHNRISLDMADIICNAFPDVSKAWVLTGEGTMLPEGLTQGGVLEVWVYFVTE